MKLKTISERDIETGNVMGPMLMLLILVALFAFWIYTSPGSFFISVGASSVIIGLGFLWFSWLPRGYNWLARKINER